MLSTYIVAPLFTFIGAIIGMFVKPLIRWDIEKRRELRAHRRKLIEQWNTMVPNVMAALERLESSGRQPSTDDVLRLLESERAYPSFQATYDQYARAGWRGLKRLIIPRSTLRRLLVPWWKPQLQASPERTVMAGTHLPARLHLVIHGVAEIERSCT